ncbi:MAG: UbiA-like protein EboC [Chitinophagaceae bacterium]|nr:UbiA-like protein EboC [Chitinophagaceae bacterium]
MRPANIVTSVADVLAGITISGFLSDKDLTYLPAWPIILLCISTIGLYGGGIVFNDVFDASLDATERPERPIPSGLISLREASLLGTLLLTIGIVSAFLWHPVSGWIAVAITVAALVYNKWGKHQNIIGPVNMGLCRGLNLLLGISILPLIVHDHYYIAFVPVVYIAAITMISRGEVHGGGKSILYFAGVLYLMVISIILLLAFQQGHVILTSIFLLAFAWMILKPLLVAIKEPIGKNIGKAVKAGVISLILMDAAWAAAFGAWYFALVILLLLPLSLYFSKLFAVT